jgi:uncharacterized coiled-coil DUF342 family protein
MVFHEMTDEIERLRQINARLETEIKRLRAERDELFLANGEVASFVASLQREIQWLNHRHRSDAFVG